MTTKNMKTNNHLKLAICIAIILLLGLSACHHHGGRRHSGFGNSDRLTGHIASELDLTNKQETLLSDIVRDLEEARQDLGDRDEFHRTIVSQFESEDLDEEYLRREAGRVIRELESTTDTFITGLGTFHASLNAEQRTKLSDFAGWGKRIRIRHN